MSAPATRPTVAIPTYNGGELFQRTLAALSRQTVKHELLICDSSSTDGSAEAARAAGARVLEIPKAQFSHGATRNLLMRESQGEHVALLSQDAEPQDEHWLARLIAAFDLGGDVAIAYGPYTPRADAAPAVRFELERWFRSLAPDDSPVLERLTARERTLPAGALLGKRGFFTDANACISRAAWRRVPFPEVSFAEDRALAIEVLMAGDAKVFVPLAPVIHSHTYTGSEQVRRCFDEWRGLREIYGWYEPVSPSRLVRQLRGELGHARRRLAAEGAPPARTASTLAAIARHHGLCRVGALLGSRADRLPRTLQARLSLEGRAGLSPWAPGASTTSMGLPPA